MAASIREVFISGRGKVGQALARDLRRCGVGVTARAGRAGWPSGPIDADLVVLARRDHEIEPAAHELSRAALLGHRRKTVAVVHCAGALGAEVLAAVRAPRVAVAQMHPLISFAARGQSPALRGGLLYVRGDGPAVRLACALGRKLGMHPHTEPPLELDTYHAAAALVANGTAALAIAGAQLLERAGLGAQTGSKPMAAAQALAPLLGSVAQNVGQLGLPRALTGPVRRGATATVVAHLRALQDRAPELLPLYAELANVQLGAAAELGDASAEALEAIAEALRRAGYHKKIH